ncbi:ankyrin repeat protein [Megavirus baoshan]|uniref:Putative ankyrin repeat protein n=1 Tax=Megavirus baoshan TaxID=2496520 RepID=A0A3S8UWS2_9VIRU|nr:ankyrin repeat protein [Megavirus baoshan]AZL89147.1 ankyrin repeat protein [Megavirus baoshan]
MTSRDKYYDFIGEIESERNDIYNVLKYIDDIMNNISCISKKNFPEDFFSVEKFMNSDNESRTYILKYAVKYLYLDEFFNLITYHKFETCSEVNIYLLLLVHNIKTYTKINKKLVYQTIELLIELGCDISYRDHLVTILASGSHNFILQLILEHGGDASTLDNMPICYAVNNHSIDNVMLLMEYGADIHTHNNHIFRYSLYIDNIDLINYCIDIGIDVNINNSIAIKYSIYNSSEIFDTLINHGADINCIDGNDIYHIVHNKDILLLKKLSDLGVRMDQMNSVCDNMNKNKNNDNNSDCDIFQLLKNNGVFDKNIIFALYNKGD